MSQQNKQALSTQQLLAYIKKVPYTQSINATNLTYSILDKKQKNFLLTNQRFVYLRGFQYIAYSNILPKAQELPFSSFLQVPAAKTKCLLSDISQCSFDRQVLTISKFQDKQIWQFICPSKACAISWCRKVQQALKQYKTFSTARYQKYEDYVKLNKQAKSYLQLKQQNSSAVKRITLNSTEKQQNSPSVPAKDNRESQRNRNESLSPFRISKQRQQMSMSKSKSQVDLNNDGSSFVVKVPDNSQEELIKVGNEALKNVDKDKVIESEALIFQDVLIMQPKNNLIEQNLIKSSNSDLKWTISLIEASPTKSQQPSTVKQIFFNRSSTKEKLQPHRISFGSKNNQLDDQTQPKYIIQVSQQPINQVRQHKFSFSKKSPKNYSNYRQSRLIISIDDSQQPSQSLFKHFASKEQKAQQDNEQSPLIIESLLNKKIKSQQKMLTKSVSEVSQDGRVNIRQELSKLKHNWAQDLLIKMQPCSVMKQFKKYVKKLLQIVIDELYMPKNLKIYPAQQENKEYITYLIDNEVYLQIYLVDQESIVEKPQRYKQAVKEFKNYDYLIEWTRNEPLLVVPLMLIFQYKGVIGMAKSVLNNPLSFPKQNKGKEGGIHPNTNHIFSDKLDKLAFELQMRINSNIFMNDNLISIIPYQSLSHQHIQAFYVQTIKDFLPKTKHNKHANQQLLLRPQFINQDSLEGLVFYHSSKGINQYDLQLLMEKNISQLVLEIQRQKEYFITPKELTELIHSFGLNISNLGRISDKIQQQWLRKIICSQAAIRSLKPLFRLQMQNCLINQADRILTKQKKSQRQVKRALSFLNLLFANSESTDRLWAQLNKISLKKFNLTWQNYYNDVNHKYILQSIMHNLKISLAPSSFNKKLFSSSITFQPQDFRSFQYDLTTYNLQYTELYEQVYEYVENKDSQSFLKLSSLITQQSNEKESYLQMLKGQKIYYDIKLSLAYFISPFSNEQLYRVDQTFSSFTYELKLTELSWCFKQNRFQKINQIVSFILQNGYKYLGGVHPIYAKLYRILAQNFSKHQLYFNKALEYGSKCLEMQMAIHGSGSKSSVLLWNEYYLISMIYYNNAFYEESLNYLNQSKKILAHSPQTQPLCIIFTALSKTYFALNLFQEAYIHARQLYQHIKLQESQSLIEYFIESVNLIKNLLERSNQVESYFKFIENDFIQEFDLFIDNVELLKTAIKITLFPYLKFMIYRSKYHLRILSFIKQLNEIAEPQHSCLEYIHSMIDSKHFPYSFIQAIKNIDFIIERIDSENVMSVWLNFTSKNLDVFGKRGIEVQWMLDMMSLMGIFGPQLLICIQ